MFSKKIVNSAGGLIALLFRKIIVNNNLLLTMDSLIDRYVNANYKTTYERTANKTNFLTTLKKGVMTLNKFIEMFKKLFKVKYMSFKVVTIYEEVEYVSEVVLKLDKDNEDTVYLLFKGLLDAGLNEYLKANIDKNIIGTSNDQKLRYTTMSKINDKKMTWKTLVNELYTIYRVNNIKIICKLEFGKNTVIEEYASIKL